MPARIFNLLDRNDLACPSRGSPSGVLLPYGLPCLLKGFLIKPASR